MSTAAIGMLVSGVALVGALAIFLAPARNAALGAWSMSSWTRRRRKPPSRP